jgi:hypothetical protein
LADGLLQKCDFTAFCSRFQKFDSKFGCIIFWTFLAGDFSSLDFGVFFSQNGDICLFLEKKVARHWLWSAADPYMITIGAR